MRIKRTLQAAGLIVAAVVLGLLTVQGTYALWSATAVAAPGSVSSASFTVNLAATPSGQVTTMTLPDGKPANVALTPADALLPGTSVYGGVVVTNSTDAGGTFNTVATVGQPTLANLSGGALSQYLAVSGKTASSSADCSSTSGYVPIGVSGLASSAVPKSGSTVFCFQVTLRSAAPSTVKGQAVNITLPLTVRQLCGVPGGC
jgi:predicted ribosomally synthesized peptide with SipW-like signal peptide